ncbi:hypothetical protein L6R52_13490 [Myxococcota bacterium]|nr:hypothetical protein [Myxococcota bacterium]
MRIASGIDASASSTVIPAAESNTFAFDDSTSENARLRLLDGREVAEREHLRAPGHLVAIVDLLEPAVGHHLLERAIDRVAEALLSRRDEGDVISGADGALDEPQLRERARVEERDAVVLHGPVDDTGLDVLHRIGAAVVVHDLDAIEIVRFQVSLGRGAPEHADSILGSPRFPREIAPGRDRAVRAHEELQPVDVIRARDEVRRAVFRQLEAVERDVDLPARQQRGQLSPLPLFELRADAELLRELRGELDLEAADDLRVRFVREDVGPTTLLISPPDEDAALLHVVEAIGRGCPRGQGDDQRAGDGCDEGSDDAEPRDEPSGQRPRTLPRKARRVTTAGVGPAQAHGGEQPTRTSGVHATRA